MKTRVYWTRVYWIVALSIVALVFSSFFLRTAHLANTALCDVTVYHDQKSLPEKVWHSRATDPTKVLVSYQVGGGYRMLYVEAKNVHVQEVDPQIYSNYFEATKASEFLADRFEIDQTSIDDVTLYLSPEKSREFHEALVTAASLDDGSKPININMLPCNE